MPLARRAGPATAACPTNHSTIMAIGTTYQAKRRQRERLHHKDIQRHREDRTADNANTADDEVLKHEVTHDLRLGGTERATHTDLPGTATDRKARQTDNAQTRDCC